MFKKSIKIIQGAGVIVHGNDIDTDRIIPARFLKRISFEGLGNHAFNDDRDLAKKEGKIHPLDDPKRQDATILLVNKNFGCGSSREAAPQALFRRGFRAVIGESFGEIFYNNSIAVGLPCLKVSQQTVSKLQSIVSEDVDAQIKIDLENKTINLKNIIYDFDIGNGPQRQFIDGSWDATSMLLQSKEEIIAKAQSLPYVSRW